MPRSPPVGNNVAAGVPDVGYNSPPEPGDGTVTAAPTVETLPSADGYRPPSTDGTEIEATASSMP